MQMENQLVHLRVRIPQRLKELMQRYVEIDAHVNESDLTRDAIREKIQRDAPELYRELIKRGLRDEPHTK